MITIDVTQMKDNPMKTISFYDYVHTAWWPTPREIAAQVWLRIALTREYKYQKVREYEVIVEPDLRKEVIEAIEALGIPVRFA